MLNPAAGWFAIGWTLLRLLPSIVSFQRRLQPRCFTCRWRVLLAGSIAGHHFRHFWVNTTSISDAHHIWAWMPLILAIRAWWSLPCRICGNTSNASPFSQMKLFFVCLVCLWYFYVVLCTITCPITPISCWRRSKWGFILERNMHFVVANIVRPLTCNKRVSFVTLWGGRQVDYFVSLGHVSSSGDETNLFWMFARNDVLYTFMYTAHCMLYIWVYCW